MKKPANHWLILKQSVAQALGVNSSTIEEPAQEGFGDFSFPCFNIAKAENRNPKEVAEVAAKEIRVKNIAEIKAVGPYVNFFVDWNRFGNLILKSIDRHYGEGDERGAILMDVFQANPYKTFHIGHVRNAILGEAIRRILEKRGKKTIPVSFNGDVGTHIAKWLWYFQNFYKGKVPKKKFMKWVGDVYADACKKSEERPEYEEQIAEINRQLDIRDKKIIPLWKKFRDLCYKEHKKIAAELGIKVVKLFPESECEEPGKNLVKKLFSEGKLEKSEGAIVLNLEKYGLNVFLLLKKDGTALYSTKDFGLFLLKKKFHKFDKLIYVVGNEQDFYFKQLFKAMDVLGIWPENKNFHVSHGLVTLKEEKMASRFGNVILYEELRDETIKRVLEEIGKRNPDLKNKEKTAKKIALGAIKFSMLDVENSRLIKFDWAEALNFEGRSGPYLQYTHARANSILEKARTKKIKNFNAEFLRDKKERELLKIIAKYPSALERAACEYQPHHLTNYLFELAEAFNNFYQNVSVLKAKTVFEKNARLKLVETAKSVLASGLELLGIEPIKKM